MALARVQRALLRKQPHAQTVLSSLGKRRTPMIISTTPPTTAHSAATSRHRSGSCESYPTRRRARSTRTPRACAHAAVSIGRSVKRVECASQ
eukprot:6181840-Pleurochrysis_carterae.AAC.4